MVSGINRTGSRCAGHSTLLLRCIAALAPSTPVDLCMLSPVLGRMGRGLLCSFVMWLGGAPPWMPCGKNRRTPGPGLHFRCAVEQWRDFTGAFGPLVEIPIADLAETINDRLDAETLRELHGALFDIIHRQPWRPAGRLSRPCASSSWSCGRPGTAPCQTIAANDVGSCVFWLTRATRWRLTTHPWWE